MFKLEAPYPNIVTTSLLPDPELGDQESNVIVMNKKRAIDGTVRTYIKKPGRRKKQWTFELERLKAYELREFLKAYQSHRIRITDHEDRVWIGYFTSNPVEFESTSDEWRVVTLEFEGVEQ